MNIQAVWRPLVAAMAMGIAAPGLAAAELPAFSGQATDLARLDNGLSVQGDDVDSPDGVTSGFRLTAGFSPPGLPRLDLGAEVSYRESDDVPVSADGQHQILDTTSLGGSLMAGVRLGRLGLYAKSGLAGWQGEAVTGVDEASPGGGMARVNGFGARLRMNRVVSQLEYESFDDPMLSHLNLLTATVHFPF